MSDFGAALSAAVTIPVVVSAVISAVTKTALELGVTDPARRLRDQLTRKNAGQQRQAAFEKAYQAAVEAMGDLTEPQQRLLHHLPFMNEVAARLLNPAMGLDWGAIAEGWGGDLPTEKPWLEHFFQILEKALANDADWGDLLVRYQALRGRPELKEHVDERGMLRELKIELTGDGAVATDGSIALGTRAVYVKDSSGNTIYTGDFIFSAPATGEAELKTYFRMLAVECAELPMGIIDEKFTGKEALSLKDVYIDLDVFGARLDRKKELHLLRRELESPQESQENQRTALIEAMAGVKTRRMVLLGTAGSGKTTFTNYLTYVLANAYAEDQTVEDLPEALRGLLPVRLVLRKVVAQIGTGSEAGQAGMLWNVLEEELKGRLGAGYRPVWERLQQEIHAGRGLVLLDGLDEVPESGQRRACLLQAVEKFLGGLPKTRVVLTARPYAYADPAWQLRGCAVFTLAPLSPEQVGRFVERWYLSVKGSINLDEAGAARRAGQLAAAIEARSYLADLASRPLLLTLMAALHSSGDDLPEDRADLYEKTVHLLLVRWQRGGAGSVIQLGDRAVQVDLTFVRQVLAELAYQTHTRQRGAQASEGPGDIPFGDLLACFYERLPQILPSDLTAYLENRTGLLVEREPKLYCFAHRSFQEYLAACHLLDTSVELSADLRRLVDEDATWWREVILLAVGRTRQGSMIWALDLVRNVLMPETLDECLDPGQGDWRAAVLGGLALLELRVLERQPKQAEAPKNVPRARRWLATLIEQGALPARERAEAGDILGRLGDPRFDRQGLGLPVSFRCQPEALNGFVPVAAGPFRMGSREDEEGAYDDEYGNPETLNMPYPYWIARYPVTVGQYAAFMAAGGYDQREVWSPDGWDWRTGAYDSKADDSVKRWLARRPAELRGEPFGWQDQKIFGNRPVVRVTWFEAAAYAAWLDGQLRAHGTFDPPSGYQVRLATEAEWEKAARGGDGRRYPWGDADWEEDRANIDDSQIGHVTAVGLYSRGAAPGPIFDLAGNVWEWTASAYRPYPYLAQCQRGVEDESAERTLRGGSWGYNHRNARCAYRDRFSPDIFNVNVGFRLVLSLAFSGF
jgi:formylglycine-generating enzyme required for sulfatase activity